MGPCITNRQLFITNHVRIVIKSCEIVYSTGTIISSRIPFSNEWFITNRMKLWPSCLLSNQKPTILKKEIKRDLEVLLQPKEIKKERKETMISQFPALYSKKKKNCHCTLSPNNLLNCQNKKQKGGIHNTCLKFNTLHSQTQTVQDHITTLFLSEKSPNPKTQKLLVEEERRRRSSI